MKTRIAAVVLAAGESRRMGDANKLTLPVGGVPMVARVVDALSRSGVAKVIVVTGHEAEVIEHGLAGRPIELVYNPDYAEGIGSSIRAGIGALGDDFDGALIALGDMPLVEPETIDRLVDAFASSAEPSVFVPTYGNRRGNPVLWSAEYFPELLALTGDVGGKSLFHRHARAICEVEVENAGIDTDVDTPDALDDLNIQNGR